VLLAHVVAPSDIQAIAPDVVACQILDSVVDSYDFDGTMSNCQASGR